MSAGKFYVGKSLVDVTLTGDELTWRKVGSSKLRVIPLDDIVGAVPSRRKDNTPILTLHMLRRKNVRKARKPSSLELECMMAEDRDIWRRSLYAAMEMPLKRSLLVLVNPFSGTKRAGRIAAKCVPYFERAGITCDVRETQHAGHATEIGATFDVAAVDGVVCVSGDGMVNEFLQGVMSRDDADAASRVPVAHLPGGTGNGFFCTLGGPHLLNTVHLIVKGRTVRMDTAKIAFDSGKVVHSMLWSGFGVLSDLEKESERYRWMGEARFDYAGFKCGMRHSVYPCKLRYLVVRPRAGVHSLQEASEDGDGGTMDAVEEAWVEHDGVRCFMAHCVPYIGTPYLSAPRCRLTDGSLDLTVVPIGASRLAVTKFLFAISDDSGGVVKQQAVEYAKVKRVEYTAHKLPPPADKRVKVDVRTLPFDVDGELFPNEDFVMTVEPATWSVMVDHAWLVHCEARFPNTPQ